MTVSIVRIHPSCQPVGVEHNRVINAGRVVRILAIETSTEACSAALLLDDEIRECYEVAPRRHGELILQMARSLLDEAGITLQQLDGLAFGRGPGSFTGVRIAVSVAQGLAFGADLPVIPLSTLVVLAEGARQETGATRILAALDARMDEVYWGAFVDDGDGIIKLQGKEQVTPPNEVRVPNDELWTGIGSGWARFGELMVQSAGSRIINCSDDSLPRARYLASLARRAIEHKLTVAADEALPVYLRDQVV